MKKIALLSLSLLLSACSTMTPARYSMSVDNNQALKQFQGSKVKLIALNAPVNFDANCRLMGPIQASDGMTIPQFVEKAFNDELKFAGLYSDEGIKLSGALNRIEFSSTSGLTNGYWLIGMELKSSNGKSLIVDNRYDFKSGFDAITACNQTAQALGPAVQDLIKKAVTNPEFVALIH
ncbi:hypothetical protein [Methylovorus mays]|uniref:hypothetical protein n=1 Tax=Methylovorus mays TaxID=184077 RepID=UPI001E54EBF0|nr:hypothetical protein [Methylovorus mays]MCB5206699.1 hypothetical protein [Methylovorus mays]